MLKPIKITIKLLILIGSFIFLYFVIQYGQFNLPSPPPSCPSSLDGLTVIFADCGQGVDYYGVLSSLMMLSIPLLFTGGVVALSDIRNKALRMISQWSVTLATSAVALRLLQILPTILREHPFRLDDFAHPWYSVSFGVTLILLIALSNILILFNKLKFVKILYSILFIVLNIYIFIFFTHWFGETGTIHGPFIGYFLAIFAASILSLLFVPEQGIRKIVKPNKSS